MIFYLSMNTMPNMQDSPVHRGAIKYECTSPCGRSVSWMSLKAKRACHGRSSRMNCLLYTSSEDQEFYRPKDLQRFIAKDQRILEMAHFNKYRHAFLIIARNLEEQNVLSRYNQDDFFWSGLKPVLFHHSLK